MDILNELPIESCFHKYQTYNNDLFALFTFIDNESSENLIEKWLLQQNSLKLQFQSYFEEKQLENAINENSLYQNLSNMNTIIDLFYFLLDLCIFYELPQVSVTISQDLFIKAGSHFITLLCRHITLHPYLRRQSDEYYNSNDMLNIKLNYYDALYNYNLVIEHILLCLIYIFLYKLLEKYDILLKKNKDKDNMNVNMNMNMQSMLLMLYSINQIDDMEVTSLASITSHELIYLIRNNSISKSDINMNIHQLIKVDSSFLSYNTMLVIKSLKSQIINFIQVFVKEYVVLNNLYLPICDQLDLTQLTISYGKFIENQSKQLNTMNTTNHPIRLYEIVIYTYTCFIVKYCSKPLLTSTSLVIILPFLFHLIEHHDEDIQHLGLTCLYQCIHLCPSSLIQSIYPFYLPKLLDILSILSSNDNNKDTILDKRFLLLCRIISSILLCTTNNELKLYYIQFIQLILKHIQIHSMNSLITTCLFVLIQQVLFCSKTLLNCFSQELLNALNKLLISNWNMSIQVSSYVIYEIYDMN